MTSPNGNIFLIHWPFVRETTGHRWIPLTKTSDVELWCFLWTNWTNCWANYRNVGDLRRHCAHYDVTVISWSLLHCNIMVIVLTRFANYICHTIQDTPCVVVITLSINAFADLTINHVNNHLCNIIFFILIATRLFYSYIMSYVWQHVTPSQVQMKYVIHWRWYGPLKFLLGPSKFYHVYGRLYCEYNADCW